MKFDFIWMLKSILLLSLFNVEVTLCQFEVIHCCLAYLSPKVFCCEFITPWCNFLG